MELQNCSSVVLYMTRGKSLVFVYFFIYFVWLVLVFCGVFVPFFFFWRKVGLWSGFASSGDQDCLKNVSAEISTSVIPDGK